MRVAKAVDADIDKNIQDKRVYSWCDEGSISEVFSRQLEVIREKLMVPWYRRLMMRSLRRYLTLIYGVDWTSILRKVKQLDRSSTGNKRKRYTKIYKNFIYDSLRGVNKICL